MLKFVIVQNLNCVLQIKMKEMKEEIRNEGIEGRRKNGLNKYFNLNSLLSACSNAFKLVSPSNHPLLTLVSPFIHPPINLNSSFHKRLCDLSWTYLAHIHKSMRMRVKEIFHESRKYWGDIPAFTGKSPPRCLFVPYSMNCSC